jgi:hypothetical protein
MAVLGCRESAGGRAAGLLGKYCGREVPEDSDVVGEKCLVMWPLPWPCPCGEGVAAGTCQGVEVGCHAQPGQGQLQVAGITCVHPPWLAQKQSTLMIVAPT